MKVPNTIRLYSEVSVIFNSSNLGYMPDENLDTGKSNRKVYRIESCGTAFLNELAELCHKYKAVLSSPTSVKEISLETISIDSKVIKNPKKGLN